MNLARIISSQPRNLEPTNPAVEKNMRYLSKPSGFTLIELVIVLGITGLIFAGLWGLLSNGSAQLQAQSAAQQYRQVIDATRKFLASPPPTSALATNPDSFATPQDINIYDDLVCGSVMPCSSQGVFLSQNFATRGSGNTYTDAFGNQMYVTVKNLNTATDDRWQFVVHSTAANPVNDKVGAQVAALIGSEGGFIYKQPTEGCSTSGTASHTSCGAYGSFAFDVQANGFVASPVSGSVATLSFTNDSALLDSPWLARQDIGNVAFNTMSTTLYFGNGNPITPDGSPNLHLRGNGISMGETLGDTAGGGIITMNNGTLSMGANSGTTGGGVLNMAGGILDNVATLRGIIGVFTFSDSLAITTSDTLSIVANGGMPINVGGNSLVISGSGGSLQKMLDVTGFAVATNFTAGSFMYNSDMSLKKQITPIESPLEKLNRLHGYDFSWKKDGTRDIGLMAQEVQKVFPTAVKPLPSGTLGVDYARLVAPIIEALHELREENARLKNELDALKKKSAAPAGI